MKRHVSFTAALLMAISTLIGVSASVAQAATCPSPTRDGATIGKVKVGTTTVAVKSISYIPGGELTPPSSPLNVGLSKLHQPLNADEGTSVLAWHINWNGCVGRLNVIMGKKVGYVFSIVDEDGVTQKFRIKAVYTPKKGSYRPEWFQLSGDRQLTLITCTGKVVKGHYSNNYVVIAEPVV